MKSVSNWLVLLLVFVGCLVGLASLYTASLTGVMSKLGLVGGDFRQAVHQNELARQLRSRTSDVSCSLWEVSRNIPTYLLSTGQEKVKLQGILGGQRIVCGIRYVQNGNVEQGIYTLIKGLYYLKSQYSEMKILVQEDRQMCRLLRDTEYESWVQAYLLSTEGRIYDVVLTVYTQVERERSGVEELCLD